MGIQTNTQEYSRQLLTIQEVAEFLGVRPEETSKLLVYKADDKIVGVVLRGDHEANEAKVRRAGANCPERAVVVDESSN